MAHHTFYPLSNTEVSAFCSQMAVILKSGISSTEGITLMLEESISPEEKALLAIIQKTLSETGSFHKALISCGIFPDYMLHMVLIGEHTGKLDDVMKSLAEHYDREASISQSIKNAVTYPLIMIFMMLLVIIVLITKVMPIFNQVFKQLGSEMTGISKVILNLGIGLNRYSAMFIVLLVCLMALLFFSIGTTAGKAWLASLPAKLSFTRALSEKIAACRFASGMALTLNSGLTPFECIALAKNLSTNSTFCTKLEACQKAMEQGFDLSDSLLNSNIFSGIYARMTSIGAKTGILDEVMNEISEKYQEEINQRFTTLIAALEPTLVIILSIIVGMILLSVILPLMGIMSSL